MLTQCPEGVKLLLYYMGSHVNLIGFVYWMAQDGVLCLLA